MFVSNAPGHSLRLGYHDAVWASDGTPEGAQTALPVNTSTDITFTPLFVTIGLLLWLLAKA